MRYRIPLVNNPSIDVALRNKYKAAFGSACYMSVVNTFDCFYEKIDKACADAKKIGEVAGIQPYEKGYDCKPDGVGNYTLQIGPDVANNIPINYQNAPLESSFVEVDGVPTEINGPYRDLPQLTTVKTGGNFYCNTSLVGADGKPLNQRAWILQVNSKAHGGELRSDLAGFKYPCDDDCGKPTTCTEPLVLKAAPSSDPDAAQVHHIARRKDLRGCFWGSNANKHAAVISARLNRHLLNTYPSAQEVTQINAVPAYTP